MSKLYPSISGLSILMALVLALGEWYFFFYGGTSGGKPRSYCFLSRRLICLAVICSISL